MEKEKPINNPDPSRPPFTYLPFQTPVSLEALLRPLLHHLRTPGIGPHEWKRITFDGRCSPPVSKMCYIFTMISIKKTILSVVRWLTPWFSIW